MNVRAKPALESGMSRQSCVVCLAMEEHPFNRLVVCGECNTRVHQCCYGGDILRSLPSTRWLCERCRFERRHPNQKLRCVFCPQRARGALKQFAVADSSERIWAHLQCVNWLPEIFCTNDE